LVAQESERLEALVERVLTATRISERTSFAELNPIDIVQSAIGLIIDRARRKSIQVVMDDSLPKDSIPKVMWDGESIRQALLNLLDNAIKFGRPGGRVDVGLSADGGWVKVSVADNGKGIGRIARRKVFGRFHRGDSEETGTGLGLFVVEQIARAHGGRVDLETEVGKGSTFTLILPNEPPQSARVPV
jgi:signal transduction histidine kinase